MVSFDDFLFEGLTTLNSHDMVTRVGLGRLTSGFSRIAIKVVFLH